MTETTTTTRAVDGTDVEQAQRGPNTPLLLTTTTTTTQKECDTPPAQRSCDWNYVYGEVV